MREEVTTWTTREGEVLLIKDMEDSHILNTLRMLERNAPIKRDRLILSMYMYSALTLLNTQQTVQKWKQMHSKT